eukprot:9359042-Ditylum_brightwellii.AAC.1
MGTMRPIFRHASLHPLRGQRRIGALFIIRKARRRRKYRRQDNQQENKQVNNMHVETGKTFNDNQ